jgi:hypothetical protein
MTTALQPPATAASDAASLGKLMADSGFFADARQGAQAAVKIMAGAELGFGPVASMTGVYIVKGNVTLSANLMAAVVQAHPLYDFRVRALTNDRAEIEFFSRGESLGLSVFTMDDARTAGLASRENWRQYPRNMLFARAMSNGAGWLVPGAFAGPIYTPEELGVEIDPETGEVFDGQSAPVTPQLRALEGPSPAGSDTTSEGDKGEGESPSATEAEPVAATLDGSPEPEPEQVEDPTAQVTDAQAKTLRELLENVGADDVSKRMLLLAAGVGLTAHQDPDVAMARLTVGQAREVMQRAVERHKREGASS